jgi:NAD(P)-dependent dehydrogenase (short-subunit alcohol dehydrogenase family)
VLQAAHQRLSNFSDGEVFMANYFLVGANSTSAKALVSILSSQNKTTNADNKTRLGLYCRNPEALKAELMASDLDPSSFHFYEGDAKNTEQLQAAAADFVSHHKVLHGFAHFPGSVLLKPLLSTRLEEFEEVLATNLTSAFVALKIFIGIFKQQLANFPEVQPSAVLISSVAAGRGLPNHEAIAAAKAGVEALARSAAASYPFARVNCVAPGLIDAKMTSKISQNERSLAASVSLNAIKRAGTGADIANAVLYFLGEQSAYVTGQVLGVDGGMSVLGFPVVQSK